VIIARAYLDDFLARIYTPRHRVGAFTVGVGAEVSLSVDCVVGNPGIALDAADEIVEKIRRYKEFEVRLRTARLKPEVISGWFGL
jgi:hypothetical protein